MPSNLSSKLGSNPCVADRRSAPAPVGFQPRFFRVFSLEATRSAPANMASHPKCAAAFSSDRETTGTFKPRPMVSPDPAVNFRFSYLSNSGTYRKVHGAIVREIPAWNERFCSLFWHPALKNTRENATSDFKASADIAYTKKVRCGLSDAPQELSGLVREIGNHRVLSAYTVRGAVSCTASS